MVILQSIREREP